MTTLADHTSESVKVGWAGDGGHLAAELRAALDARVRTAVYIGVESTETHDVGYGLRQLTDVAVKALSPGINDPTTAVHALDHTAALLCELATCDLSHACYATTNIASGSFCTDPSWATCLSWS